MKKFLSLVSDPLKFGRGHLARQLQVQLEFEKLGIDHTILINNAESISLPLGQAWTLILDLSTFDDEPGVDFLERFTETIGFDWSGRFIPDRNFVVLAHPDKKYQASKPVSVGLHNLIIRDELAIIREDLQPSGEEYLLISLGYSSRTKAYRDALSLNETLPKMAKILAPGCELDIWPTEDLKIVVDSSNFIELMAEAKAVISNGGTTYIESLLLGKSVLSIPQTKDEQFFVDTIHPLTTPDLALPGFRKIDRELASKAGVGTQGAKKLCEVMLENL